MFPSVIKFLDDVKYDIVMSPGKIEDYLEACRIVGNTAVLPTSYCSSRFLDRWNAVRDRIEHLDSLKEFKNAKIPKRVRNGKDTVVKDLVEDLIGSTDVSDEEQELTKNPIARVQYMKKALSDDNIL